MGNTFKSIKNGRIQILNELLDDKLIEGKFRYLRVWKLFDNSWKVILGSVYQIQE